jgi:hypothetical protein
MFGVNLGSGFSEGSKRREDRGEPVILWRVFQLLEIAQFEQEYTEAWLP